MVVVLPAPLGPRRPSTSPGRMSKSTSAIATVRPNRRVSERASTPTPGAVLSRLLRTVVDRGRREPVGGDAVGVRRAGDEGVGRVLPLGHAEAVGPGLAVVDPLVVER